MKLPRRGGSLINFLLPSCKTLPKRSAKRPRDDGKQRQMTSNNQRHNPWSEAVFGQRCRSRNRLRSNS